MKKIIIVFSCMLFISVNSFAEFVITPTLGASNVFSTDVFSPTVYIGGLYSHREKSSLSWTPMNFGLSLGTVKEKGFTFLFSVDALFIGNVNANYKRFVRDTEVLNFKAKAKIGGGAVAQGNFLFGYTYKGVSNLYLTFASGLTLGGGVNTVKEISTSGITASDINISLKTANFGIPLYFSASYYFTDKIGINVSFLNSFCAGWQWYNDPSPLPYLGTGYGPETPAFVNVFTFKIGPTFKL